LREAVFLRIIVEEQMPGEIPVLELYNPDLAGKLPTVIILHGFHGHKARHLSDSYHLAKHGLYVVAMDAYRHGDLLDDSFARLTRAERTRDFWEIVMKTAPMIDRLVGYYKNHDKADGRRIGLLGRSMGGMVIYHYLATGQPMNVKAAVIMASTPAWMSFERQYLQKNPELKAFFSMGTTHMTVENEPNHRIEALKDLPLLLVNGIDDPVIPIDDVRRSFTRLQTVYQNKERLRLSEYQGIGHQVTPSMVKEAAAWLERYL
jgi:alpha-beta hydrolase superfamily lysophospholipase